MPFSIFSRRNQTEGWAVDNEAETVTPNKRERLANNTTLWIACAVAIFALSVAMIAVSGGDSHVETVLRQMSPGDEVKGHYMDEAHLALVERFIAMEKKRGVDVEAEFIADDEFKIVVAGDVGYDEIAYMSRFVALAVKRRFGNGSIVYAYSKDIRQNKLRLTATTQWSEQEHNFVTKAERALQGE